MRILDSSNIKYSQYEYEANQSLTGEEIASILHEDVNSVFKTLITKGKSNDYYAFMIPVNKELDLKKAAKTVCEKSVEMIPFKDLLKRILSGKDPRCVIYKITNIKTGEIYIGKTKAEVSKRWTEHIKTSLNIGTIARSKIHEVLFLHWDDFTFEILEEVKDETKLSLREKYYINFYQSNIYGYNMNSGG